MADRDQQPVPKLAAEDRSVRRRLFRAALHAEDSYVLLFALLMLDLLAAAFATSATALAVLIVLVAATLLIALRTSHVGQKATRFAAFAVVACVLFGFVASARKDPVLAGWMFAAMAALLVVTPAVIGRRIMAHREVTVQTLFGAVSVYVIFGLMFAFIYMAINFITGNPFYTQGGTNDPVNYIYASYITLTTVGYGDFTPVQSYGKMLVAIEALIGQVFLVTAVARLVSIYARSEDAAAKRRAQLEQPAEDSDIG